MTERVQRHTSSCNNTATQHTEPSSSLRARRGFAMFSPRPSASRTPGLLHGHPVRKSADRKLGVLLASASSFINSSIAVSTGSRLSEHPLRVATAARVRNHGRRGVSMRPTHVVLRGTCPTPERPGCLRLPQENSSGARRLVRGAWMCVEKSASPVAFSAYASSCSPVRIRRRRRRQ